jgi:SAM-dependent methyltransferase
MAASIAETIRPIEVRPRDIDAPRADTPAAWNAFYNEIYRAARSITDIPWAGARPCPALVSWLNAEAPALIRPGASVAVVGCGLGDDVREIFSRGYDVLGFDVCPRAIDWARDRHPELGDRLLVADAFDLPRNLMRRHDLVVEVCTLQSVHPCLRRPLASGIVSLARPRGTVLAICRGRDDAAPPPARAPPPRPPTPSPRAN